MKKVDVIWTKQELDELGYSLRSFIEPQVHVVKDYEAGLALQKAQAQRGKRLKLDWDVNTSELEDRKAAHKKKLGAAGMLELYERRFREIHGPELP